MTLAYYQLLDVSPSATTGEIHASYLRLAFRYHPDLNPHDTAAIDRFRRIQAAYEVLRDPRRRRAYDRNPYQPRPKSVVPAAGKAVDPEPPPTAAVRSGGPRRGRARPVYDALHRADAVSQGWRSFAGWAAGLCLIMATLVVTMDTYLGIAATVSPGPSVPVRSRDHRATGSGDSSEGMPASTTDHSPQRRQQVASRLQAAGTTRKTGVNTTKNRVKQVALEDSGKLDATQTDAPHGNGQPLTGPLTLPLPLGSVPQPNADWQDFIRSISEGSPPLAVRGIPLQEFDLPNVDLASVDLASVDLASVDLASVDLASGNLHGKDLHGVDIPGIDWYSVEVPRIERSPFEATGTALPNVDMAPNPHRIDVFFRGDVSSKQVPFPFEAVDGDLQFASTAPASASLESAELPGVFGGTSTDAFACRLWVTDIDAVEQRKGERLHDGGPLHDWRSRVPVMHDRQGDRNADDRPELSGRVRSDLRWERGQAHWKAFNSLLHPAQPQRRVTDNEGVQARGPDLVRQATQPHKASSPFPGPSPRPTELPFLNSQSTTSTRSAIDQFWLPK